MTIDDVSKKGKWTICKKQQMNKSNGSSFFMSTEPVKGQPAVVVSE